MELNTNPELRNGELQLQGEVLDPVVALLEQPLLELLLGREALGVGVDQRREVREEEVPARGDATRAWARGGDTAEAGSEAVSEAGCMAPLRRVPA